VIRIVSAVIETNQHDLREPVGATTHTGINSVPPRRALLRILHFPVGGGHGCGCVFYLALLANDGTNARGGMIGWVSRNCGTAHFGTTFKPGLENNLCFHWFPGIIRKFPDGVVFEQC
jgi:hypothetical protein